MPLDLSRNENIIITSILMSTALISFIASSTMAIMILKRGDTRNALGTPYRRLIFGLSVADICQSWSLLVGPFMVPANTPGSFPVFASVGSTLSCEANGLFLTFGAIAASMYSCGLCIYYLCKIKFNMDNETFRWKIELPFLHFIILSSSTIAAWVGVFTNSFNATPTAGFCTFSEFPIECDVDPNVHGECMRGADTYKYTLAFTVIPDLISFLIITVTLMMLYCHVVRQGRLYSFSRIASSNSNIDTVTGSAGEDSNVNDGRRSFSTCACRCSQFIRKRLLNVVNADAVNVAYDLRQRENETLEEFTQRMQLLYGRETVKQVILYVGVFALVHIPPNFVIMLIACSDCVLKNSIPLFVACAFIYPLGGLFNIMVYTRPKVISFLSTHPESSYLPALWEVIKAGGDLPDELALLQPLGTNRSRPRGYPCCCSNSLPSMASDVSMQTRTQTRTITQTDDSRFISSVGGR